MISVVIILIMLVVLLVLIMPLKLEIIRNNNQLYINLYLILLFNKKIKINKKNQRYEPYVYYYYKTRELLKNKHVIKTFFRMCSLERATMIYYSKNIYNYVLYSNLIYIFDDFVSNNFKGEINKYYDVRYNEDLNEDLKLNLNINFRLIYILFIMISNFKEFTEIIKILKKGR